MEERGWEQLDLSIFPGCLCRPSVFRTCDHYETLEAHGFKVGIIAQPDWKDKNSITILGEPRLGFLVSAGNMDSMVNHYSVSKKAPQNGCLYAGRRDGKTSGLRSGCIQ